MFNAFFQILSKSRPVESFCPPDLLSRTHIKKAMLIVGFSKCALPGNASKSFKTSNSLTFYIMIFVRIEYYVV